MQFNDDVVGGVSLIRPAIQSVPYEPGVTGWTIDQDGHAEFNDITIRGGVTIGGDYLAYTGTPGVGTLVFSISADGGTDEFGNTYPPGLAAFVSGDLVAHIQIGSDPGYYTYGSRASSDYVSSLVESFLNFAVVGQANGGFIGYSDLEPQYALEFDSGNAGSGATSAFLSMVSESASGTDDSVINLQANSVSVLGDLSVSGIGKIITEVKPSDTSRNNTTTLTADPHLVLPVAANADYRISGAIYFAAPDAVDINMQLSGPAGSSGKWSGHGNGLGTVGQTTNGYSMRAEVQSLGNPRSYGGTTGSAGDFYVPISGTLHTGGTSGNLSLLWAQVASNAAFTHVRSESWLELRRYA